ncbi:UDP-N-acetylglucosamine 2-epimerase [Marinomonas communis]|uniref:UDP-N-acetylglucosamine 2-epimerase (Non-hydrolysing) n=1 Tax=Marinomonas communis TaxID=28254 RepID=A0A4R6XCC1_9GAMM|nr:UDP-N-acetylglucosamine 2-epimerase [Marinomonas communis]TDR13228.1 UDP-N-acetylglucosamine 2-epimerase (non-hydrolysing) [Marinomonas communis]
MIKITVFTGTRAEYGLLYWLLKDIQAQPDMTLQLLVAGSHLSPEFGETYQQIEHDGFVIDEKVEMLLSSNTATGTAKSLGLGILGFTDALTRLKPDAIVILGDRFEALAAAQSAAILRIPVIHLHGGEITEGAYDDAFRHAITKFSYFHGTATEPYRRRVIQLGESPERVFNIGAVGLDHIKRSNFMSLDELSKSLDFELNDPYFLVTYHPVTAGEEDPITSFQALLKALDYVLDSHKVILTYPNADDGGRLIIPILEAYARAHSNRVLSIKSLGQIRYLSAVKHATAVIGNSSSGIIEVPSFNVPTVNIGIRQKGRLAASSVLNTAANETDIVKTILAAIQWHDTAKGKQVDNPYGQGNASEAVIQMIRQLPRKPVKTFYDLDYQLAK